MNKPLAITFTTLTALGSVAAGAAVAALPSGAPSIAPEGAASDGCIIHSTQAPAELLAKRRRFPIPVPINRNPLALTPVDQGGPELPDTTRPLPIPGAVAQDTQQDGNGQRTYRGSGRISRLVPTLNPDGTIAFALVSSDLA